MAYFGAVMQFTPVGLPGHGGFEVGGALSFIPALDDEDRAAGFGGTKYENTNHCPVFPRLTAGHRHPSFGIEAAWTPPVRVCGVKANILALALSARRTMGRSLDGVARLSAVAGSLRAPITCGEDDVADPADQTCFGGAVSDDRMAPLSVAAEAGIALRRWRRVEPYLLAGIAVHRMHFDVNYDRITTNPLPVYPNLSDHNQFGATLARVHAVAGLAARAGGPVRLGAELYIAPGALITVRGRAAIVLGALHAN